MLSHELEKCQTQLAVVTAELEKSKEAPPGNVPLHPEKYTHIPVMLILLRSDDRISRSNERGAESRAGG